MELQFDEVNHKYTYNGQGLISVTELISKFFPFNMEEVAKAQSLRTGMPFEYHLEELKLEREVSAQYGKRVHKEAELVLNNVVPTSQMKEVQQVRKFLEDHAFLKPFKVEWQIFSEAVGIAGTIDLVMEDSNGELYIFDWKTSKEMYIDSIFRGLPPFDHLDNSNYTTYSLQLNLYKFILEHFYARKVKYIGIVHLDASRETYELLQALEMDDEVYKMLCLFNGVPKSIDSAGNTECFCQLAHYSGISEVLKN